MLVSLHSNICQSSHVIRKLLVKSLASGMLKGMLPHDAHMQPPASKPPLREGTDKAEELS